MNDFGLGQEVEASIERHRPLESTSKIAGYFDIEIWRDGKLFHKERAKNGVTNIGKDSILDWAFRNQTQPTTWYLGFIDNAGFSALAAADTMASHSGWTESVAYSDANRQTWVTDAAASQSITNSTVATFNINASATLYGIFVVDNNTKGGATGTLWATAAFSSTIPVVNTDVVKITYTVNAT